MTRRLSSITVLRVGAALIVCATVGARVGLPPAATLLAQTPAPDGWVVLPVQEYRALRAKAFPPDRPPDPSPVDAAISSIEYDLTVNGESASGHARVTVDVLEEGWVRIPMPAGLLIREARLDARPVALVDDPHDASRRTPSVLLSRAGRSILTLDLVVPIATRAGTEMLALPASAAATMRAVLAVPRADVEVSAAGGFVGEQAKDAKSTRIVAFGHGGQPLSLSWTRTRENPRATQPLRLRSAVTQVVGLGEDAGQATTRVQLDVVQGLAPSVAVTLPDDFTVNEVSGALVSDWEIAGRTLAVTFLEPVSDRATFVIAGEFRPPREGRIAVPLVHVAHAERETGGVAVEVLGAGEITRHDARGLDPADPSDLGDALAGRDAPALVAFRYRASDGQAARALAVTVSRYTPQAVLLANVEDARYRVLLAEDGKLLVEGRFAVRNNQRSFLGVTLPAGATLWSAAIDGRAVRPGTSADGTLLVPLRKTRAGGDAPLSAVQIVYLARQAAWTTNGQVRLSLPALDVPVSRTGLTVDFSPRFRVALEPGAFRINEELPITPVLASFDAALSAGAEGRGAGSRTYHVKEADGQSEIAAALRQDANAQAVDRLGAAGGDRDGKQRSADEQRAADDLRGLADRFQREHRSARAPGVLPVRLWVPRVGSTLHLASELTPERVAPEATLTYKREGR